MAIFHLEFANGKVGKGLAHFNYISGEDKYKNKKEKEIGLQINNMPKWADSPQHFWTTADLEERANGRVYKEIRIALPNQFSKKENENLLKEFLKKELGKNYYYTAVIHNKDEKEKKNIHAHIMICPRKRDNIKRDEKSFFKRYNSKYPERGGALKDPYWNKRETLLHFRESWEETLNNSLEKKSMRKVSCKSLKQQREEALLKGDKDLADLLDREPVNISGYLLKLPDNKLSEDEKLTKEIFETNQEIKEKKYYLYDLIQKEKELKVEKDLAIEDIRELNSNISNFELKEKEELKEFGDIYDIEENILLLEHEKEYTENELTRLNNTEEKTEKDLKEIEKLETKILGITSELEKNNLLFEKEIEKLKVGDAFEEKYQELNAKNFQRDLKRFYKTERNVNKLKREIKQHNKKLNDIKNSTFNILTKGRYGSILNSIKKIDEELNKEGYVISEEFYKKEKKKIDALTREKEKIENKFKKGNDKNRFIRISENLDKKYKTIIKNKEKELEKQEILNRIILNKLDLKDGNKIYFDSLELTNEKLNYLNDKISKLMKQVKILTNTDINSVVYNKISKGRFSEIKKEYDKNDNEIEKLKVEMKSLNVFNFSKKNKLVKEINNLSTENEKLNDEYLAIKNSLPKEEIKEMKNEVRIKLNIELDYLREKLTVLKNERADYKNVKVELKDKLYKKLGVNNSPSLKNFEKNHRANLGQTEGGGTAIKLGNDEDVWAKRMRRELDFGR